MGDASSKTHALGGRDSQLWTYCPVLCLFSLARDPFVTPVETPHTHGTSAIMATLTLHEHTEERPKGGPAVLLWS